jgi:uncharacterized membrane-anchored protein
MLLTAALSVLGVTTGALAARVAELQVILIPVSAVSIGVAHYVAYRRGDAGRRRERILLWGATVLSVGLWVVPAILR